VPILQHILWFFWPVKKGEHTKTFSILLVLFLVSFVYNILRTLKLTILLAEPDLSSQAISYLKIFAIMPAAVFFTLLTTQMQTILGQCRTFTAMVCIFGAIFAFLTLGVLPYKEFYRLNFTGTHELIMLMNDWYITLFYVAAEMWSSIMLNMLCWGIIIEITKLSDSKRLYSLFALSANLATCFAGWWGSGVVEQQFKAITGIAQPTWEQALLFQMIMLWIIQGLIIVAFNYAMSQQKIEEQRTLEKRFDVNFLDSIKLAFAHPIIRSVAVMMISFNIVYHMVDVIHNEYVRAAFATTPKLMNWYFNEVNKYLGIFAILFSWLLSGSFVRRFGLGASLLFTPMLWFSLSLLDFLSSMGYIHIFSVHWQAVLLPVSLLSFSLILSMGRAAKFTIFDTAREMSFLTLSQHEKRLGKAAVDGLTSRFGKTGGAWLVIVIVGQAGQVLAALLPLKATIFVAYGLWFWAALTLISHLPKEKQAELSIDAA
jgi:AAA family ATP:ADP antiporter